MSIYVWYVENLVVAHGIQQVKWVNIVMDNPTYRVRSSAWGIKFFRLAWSSGGSKLNATLCPQRGRWFLCWQHTDIADFEFPVGFCRGLDESPVVLHTEHQLGSLTSSALLAASVISTAYWDCPGKVPTMGSISFNHAWSCCTRISPMLWAPPKYPVSSWTKC